MPIMKAVELQGEIDDQHRLHADVRQSVPAGSVRVIVLISEEHESVRRLGSQGIIRMVSGIE